MFISDVTLCLEFLFPLLLLPGRPVDEVVRDILLLYQPRLTFLNRIENKIYIVLRLFGFYINCKKIENGKLKVELSHPATEPF